MSAMQNYTYDEVKSDEETENIKSNKLTRLFLIRQLFVLSGVWVIYFSLGLSFGIPTVLIYQIRREANSSDAVSHEMESWITSIHGYSALPFIFIIPISSQKYGRKIPFILVCLNTAVAYIVLCFSTTTVHILISEIMQGVLLASNMTLLLPICSEYSAQCYRGLFSVIQATCFFWGVWVANAVGTFFHWKNIGIIGMMCCVYTFSAIFWPESPSWLALTERYDEAAAAHHWLKGHDVVSEKELVDLIKSQKSYHESRKTNTTKTYKYKVKLIIDTVIKRSYYYPLLMTMMVMSLYHFSGKMVYIMYAVQVIHQITNSEETAFLGMLLLEGITILGMSFGCVIFKYLKRRTLLLTTTSISVVSLYIISLYLYLASLGVCKENNIVSILLLGIFSVTISCGPLVVSSPIFVELVSLRYKCSSLMILTIYSEILMATLLKLAPSIFSIFTLHGAFLFFALFATVFTGILYVYLPETKGKSLQEIEDSFKN